MGPRREGRCGLNPLPTFANSENEPNHLMNLFALSLAAALIAAPVASFAADFGPGPVPAAATSFQVGTVPYPGIGTVETSGEGYKWHPASLPASR